MSNQTRTVKLVDTSLRDGNQSLWGATGLTTGMVEAIGPALERAGFHALDFTSSTHLSVGVRWHRENPWERIARMRKVVPSTPLSLITTGMRFMAWDRSPESVMRLAFRSLAAHGMRRLQIAEPMNDTDAALAVAKLAKDEGIEQVVAAVTFTESPVHTDDLYLRAAEALTSSALVDAVYLKDPSGLLTLERTQSLIPGLRNAVGDKPFELHSHCTTGVAPQVYVLAAQLGVDILHTAIGALSNGNSQPSATRLVANLAAVGIDVDIDLDAVAEAERLIDAVAAQQGLAPGEPSEFDLTPHQHQVPGGMMGTLTRQLDEMRIPDALPDVLEEVARVRSELGYPIMVTPYSQFVGSQSVFNVVAERSGQPRYATVPDEVIRYVLGQFGPPPGPIADVVRERIETSPRTKELDVPPAEPSVDDLRESVASTVGHSVGDDEVVLRMVLPAAQLDPMYAAGAAPEWAPVAAPASIGAIEFIDAVSALPNWRSLDIHLGQHTVSLRRAADEGHRT